MAATGDGPWVLMIVGMEIKFMAWVNSPAHFTGLTKDYNGFFLIILFDLVLLYGNEVHSNHVSNA